MINLVFLSLLILLLSCIYLGSGEVVVELIVEGWVKWKKRKMDLLVEQAFGFECREAGVEWTVVGMELFLDFKDKLSVNSCC